MAQSSHATEEHSAQENTPQPPHVPRWYESWTFLILFCVVLPITFRSVAYSPFNIPSGSMKPTLLVGDYIFVEKFAYGYSRYSFPFAIIPIEGRTSEKRPQRGDVVVFRLPINPSVDYIKRLVGLPGDRIQVKEGELYINGEKVVRIPDGTFMDSDTKKGEGKPIDRFIEELKAPGEDRVVRHATLDETSQGNLDNTEEFIVPEKKYFFMGDNRDNSADSRVKDLVGFVPEENLIGRAVVVGFSCDAPLWQVWRLPGCFRGERFFIPIP